MGGWPGCPKRFPPILTLKALWLLFPQPPVIKGPQRVSGLSPALPNTHMARGRCRKALPWVAPFATHLCRENGDPLLPYVGVKNRCTLLLTASLSDNLGKPFGKVTVLGDDRTHDGVDMVFCGPFVKACGAL